MNNKAIIIAALVVLVLVIAYVVWRRASRADHFSGRASLREAMHRLWSDHVHRTHHFIVSALGHLPDLDAVAAHLHENQDDIAAAVGKYYGPAAAQELGRLLHEHIDLAARLVLAHRDHAPTADLEREWFRNADDIARLLSHANPHWAFEPTSAMMKEHLRATAALLTFRLKHDWAAAVKQHDVVVDQALHMADALTDGIRAHKF